jgi:hypothetical protein
MPYIHTSAIYSSIGIDSRISVCNERLREVIFLRLMIEKEGEIGIFVRYEGCDISTISMNDYLEAEVLSSRNF